MPAKKTGKILSKKRTGDLSSTSNRLLSNSLDYLLEGCEIIDYNWRYRYLNEAATKRTRKSREELLGHTMMEMYPGIENTSMFSVLRYCMEKRSPCRTENEISYPDGSKRTFELHIEPIHEGILILSFEITEHKQVEKILFESEDQYRDLFENAPVGYLLVGKDGKIVKSNQCFANMLGYTIDELKSLPIMSLYIDAPRERVKKIETGISISAGKDILENESRMIRKDGSRLWVSTIIHPVANKRGQIIATHATVIDITDRKKAEEELANEVMRRRILVNQSIDGIVVLDQDGKVYEANKRFTEMLGYSPQEILNLHLWDWDAQASPERLMEVMQIANEMGTHFETKLRRKDGIIFDVEISSNAANIAGSKYVFSVCRDITERKKAKEELADEMMRRRILVDQSKDGIVTIDQDGKVYDANKRFAEMIGYSPQEILNLHVWDWDTHFPREKLLDMIRSIDEAGDHFETYHRRKDGTTYDVEISTNAAEFGNQKLVFCVCRDITDRKKSEEALRVSQERFKNLADLLPQGVIETDAGRMITYMNRVSMEQFGYSEEDVTEGISVLELIAPGVDLKEAIDGMDRLIQEKETGRYEFNAISKDGRKFSAVCYSSPILADDRVIGMRAVIIDVTGQNKAQEKVRNAMKATVEAVAMTTEIRDPYTSGHQKRVAELACAIAREIGLSETRIEGLRLAGIVHDIGKMYVPAEILVKPGKLNEIEFSLIKVHPQAGYDILKGIEFPWPIAQIVLEHHERMDGSGYPRGISGNDLLQETRILTVADVVEAMASHRPYRPAPGIDEALKEIVQNKDKLYDPEVVDACIDLFKRKDFEFSKVLNEEHYQV